MNTTTHIYKFFPMNSINKMSKIVLVAMFTFFVQSVKAQSNANSILDWTYEHIIFILAALVTILALSALAYVAKVTFGTYENEISGGAEMSQPVKKEDGFFKKLYNKSWNLIPMDREKDIDLGHDYDGIRELDNSLPPWWLYMFYITITWGAIYIYIYHISGIGKSQIESYNEEVNTAEIETKRYLALQSNSVDELSVVTLSDAASLANGKKIYVANCAACHGMEGQGLVGPNFTDKYWKHGGDIKDLFKTIKYGVTDKGMQAWGSTIPPTGIQEVASYILTLQGTNPPNPKAPEGELYEPEAK